MFSADKIQTIGVVGLGLIGGSFVKSFRKYSDKRILACDLDEGLVASAIEDEILNGALTDESIAECDLIIPALYPAAIVKWMQEHAHLIKKDTLVIDTGGLKRNICAACFPLAKQYGFTFVGGHPMAGKKFSGFQYATGHLFRESSLIVVPDEDHFEDQAFLDELKKVFEPCRFGKLTVCSADKHDAMIAFTSEMAHIVSSAYIKSPTAKEHNGFSAGSYRDMTRVAWLNEDMWTGIFLENRDKLETELNYIIKNLEDYKEALANNDAKRLWQLLHEGKLAKEEVDGV